MSVDVHTLIGAYVLDALPPDERAHFERHLNECDACGAEVRDLHAVAARLGISAEEPAPPSLRRRVLSAIDVVRPLAPGRNVQSSRPWGRRVALAAAAAVALVTGGVVGAQLGDRGTPAFDAVAGQVLSAPDVRSVVLEGDRGVQASLHWSPDLDQGVLVAGGLTAPAGGGVYHLWAHREGQPRPAGFFYAPEEGTLSQSVRGLRGVQKIAVTIEPEAGATVPTGPVILQGALA